MFYATALRPPQTPPTTALLPSLLVAVALASDPAVAAGEEPNTVEPVTFAAFTLQDQFRANHTVGGPSKGVAVMLYGDRDAAEACGTLGAALHVAFHPSADGKTPVEAAEAPVRPVPGAPAGSVAPPVS
ncbi:hypothetical protein, partial [Alienimonas chondri]|uniref:hypothetical protein n=1 Tax=Alienimonas chondri TaxID=2681879 RepID=UPI001488DB8C